jgi:hypothetical protein
MNGRVAYPVKELSRTCANHAWKWSHTISLNRTVAKVSDKPPMDIMTMCLLVQGVNGSPYPAHRNSRETYRCFICLAPRVDVQTYLSTTNKEHVPFERPLGRREGLGVSSFIALQMLRVAVVLLRGRGSHGREDRGWGGEENSTKRALMKEPITAPYRRVTVAPEGFP